MASISKSKSACNRTHWPFRSDRVRASNSDRARASTSDRARASTSDRVRASSSGLGSWTCCPSAGFVSSTRIDSLISFSRFFRCLIERHSSARVRTSNVPKDTPSPTPRPTSLPLLEPAFAASTVAVTVCTEAIVALGPVEPDVRLKITPALAIWKGLLLFRVETPHSLELALKPAWQQKRAVE
jgi:hypothetical protein